jgi:hypothetical protein
MLFILIDRIESQITRNKVEQIQIRYCETERLYIAKTRSNGQIHFSKLLLLLSKLRALDALSKFKKHLGPPNKSRQSYGLKK